jgi:hypothetical protein
MEFACGRYLVSNENVQLNRSECILGDERIQSLGPKCLNLATLRPRNFKSECHWDVS